MGGGITHTFPTVKKKITGLTKHHHWIDIANDKLRFTCLVNLIKSIDWHNTSQSFSILTWSLLMFNSIWI